MLELTDNILLIGSLALPHHLTVMLLVEHMLAVLILHILSLEVMVKVCVSLHEHLM